MYLFQCKHRTDADHQQLLSGDRFGICDVTKLHADNFDMTKAAEDVMLGKPYLIFQVGHNSGRVARTDKKKNVIRLPDGSLDFHEVTTLRSAITVGWRYYYSCYFHILDCCSNC